MRLLYLLISFFVLLNPGLQAASYPAALQEALFHPDPPADAELDAYVEQARKASLRSFWLMLASAGPLLAGILIFAAYTATPTAGLWFMGFMAITLSCFVQVASLFFLVLACVALENMVSKLNTVNDWQLTKAYGGKLLKTLGRIGAVLVFYGLMMLGGVKLTRLLY